ncbi:hypothetical protein F5Y08DRAFT_345302 [Xylaria arbuscula]|nr:hypothetical protein F5Y08DRAFT_345302 [Xylaria arbuscula]
MNTPTHSGTGAPVQLECNILDNDGVSRPLEMNTPTSNPDNFMKLISEANEANERERNMGLLEAVRKHYMAIAWSVFASLGIVMIGYSTATLGTCESLALLGSYGGFFFPSAYFECRNGPLLHQS